MSEMSAIERQVQALADHYLDQLQAGNAPSRDALVAAHPQIAEFLGPRLALVELMHRLARAKESAEGQGGKASEGQPSLPFPPDERVVRLNCPHCGSRLQLVMPAPGDVTCDNCGSSFTLGGGDTTSYRPEKLPSTFGRFRVLELLGRGAFGAVYKASDEELDRLVAIKVPRAGYFVTPEEEERFLREARSAAQLRHPGIVEVHEIGREQGLPFLVTAFVQGVTLADLLTGGRPGFRESAELVARVAEALQFAHDHRIVHRDIKPSNILVDASGRPHLTDFGLARREEEVTVTLDGQILGTPAYMSPEQAAGEPHRTDGRTDVYSLGVVLYELLTGELPFRGNRRMLLHHVLNDEPRPPRSLNDRIPRDLETVCLKALAKEPHRRYQTAAAFADDLWRVLQGRPVLARPASRGERLWRWCRRNPAVASLAAAAVLLLAGGTAVSTLFALAARRQAREASEQTLKAEASAEAARNEKRLADRRLYLADIRLVRHAWDGGQTGRVRELLDGQHPERTGADLRGFEWYYWDRLCEMNLRKYQAGRRAAVLLFAPDGGRLFCAGPDGPVTSWESAGSRETAAHLQQPGGASSDWVKATALSPDGARLARAGRVQTPAKGGGQVVVWDAAGGKELLRLEHGKTAFRAAAFSPGGKWLAAGDEDGSVTVWDSVRGDVVQHLDGDSDAVTALAFGPDGKRLAAAFKDTTLRVWETATGRKVRDLEDHRGEVRHLAFSPDGRWLASAGGDQAERGELRLWDLASGRKRHAFSGHLRTVNAVAFSPDGRRLASAGQDHTVRVWDVSGGQELFQPARHLGPVIGLTFSPDGRVLASCEADGTVKISAAADPERIALVGPTAGIRQLAFSEDGGHLATSHRDQTVRLWHVAAGVEVVPPPEASRVRFGPGRQRLATADKKTVTVWDSASGRPLVTLKGHEFSVAAVAFSPDGRRTATSTSADASGFPGELKVWDGNGKQVLNLEGHQDWVGALAFSPDGERLASGGWDRTVKLWDAGSGRLLRTFEGHTDWVGGVAFSPDGGLLASAGGDWDRTVRVWDVTSGEPVHILRGHTDSVQCLAFSPDGRQLASGSGGFDWPGEVKVWDLGTGQETITLPSADGEVTRLAFSPDGKRLAAAAGSDLIVWDVRPWSQELRVECEARSLIQFAAGQAVLKDEVIARIRRDGTAGEQARQRALAWAEHYRDDPERLRQRSWSVVLLPGASPDTYRLAVRQAEAARRLQPANDEALAALGAGQYRLGEYQAAVKTLREADRIQAGGPDPARPRTLAFLAMGQQKIGERGQAKATLSRLAEALKTAEAARDETRALLQEVQAQFPDWRP